MTAETSMAWAELTDVRCYYELLGEGEPLLLIPGLGTTCRLWDGVAPELASRFSLILVDNRNVGRSVGKRKPRSLADLVSDLVELLDRLQLERAHVMGISLGGVIAQRLAVDHPGRVDRLVLVSCADRFTPYLRQVASLLGHSLRHFPKEAFVRTMELLGTSPQYLDENEATVEQRVAAKCASRVSGRALAEQLRCLASSEIDPRYYRILAPTLVVAGQHDALIPSCYSRTMSEQIPGSRYVMIRGAGHNPLVDYPDRVLPTVTRFLSARDAGAPDDDDGNGGRAYDHAEGWEGAGGADHDDDSDDYDNDDNNDTPGDSRDTEAFDWRTGRFPGGRR
jgi:pimeloyl-ACP methyl ester carboxylesterase